MKVKELLWRLKALPLEAVVLCAADAEGNAYGELVNLERSTIEYVQGCARTTLIDTHAPETPAVTLWPMGG